MFAHVAQKGGALRRLHLMEDAAIGDAPFPFTGDSDNVVGKPVFVPLPQAGGEQQMGRVQINPDQYFETDRILREILLPLP